MPNLTVSTPVDTFMQATTQAQMRTAIGVAAATLSGLPQWTYVVGGGSTPNASEFTWDGGIIRMNRLSVGGYDANVLFSGLGTNMMAGGMFAQFTNLDGDTITAQLGGRAYSDPVVSWNATLYGGAAFEAGNYTLIFVNISSLELLIAGIGIAPFTGNSGGLNFVLGICTGP